MSVATKEVNPTPRAVGRPVKRSADPVTVGDRIQKVRIERGISQVELTNALNKELKAAAAQSDPNTHVRGTKSKVSRSTVSVWETSTNMPSFAMVQILAGILGVSPSYIAFGHGDSEDHVSQALQPYESMTKVREIRFGKKPGDLTEVRNWGIPSEYVTQMTDGSVEDLVIVAVTDDGIREYEKDDLLYVDLSHTTLGNGIYYYWNGVSAALAQMNIVPGKTPKVRISEGGVDLDPLDIDDVTVLGRVKGRFTLR